MPIEYIPKDPEFKDIASLPEFVRAQLADSATMEIFRTLYNASRALGLSAVESLDDAWGRITESGTRTADGKYRITGDLLPQPGQKFAPYGALAKSRDTLAAARSLLGRLEKIEARAVVDDPTKRTYRIVSKEDDDMLSKTHQKFQQPDIRVLAAALVADAQAHPIDLHQVGALNGKKE